MIVLALVAPAPAAGAPAIEQYGTELGAEARPGAGGSDFEAAFAPSPGGVSGESEPPSSGLDAIADTLAKPLGLLAVLTAVALGVAASRRAGARPA